MSSEITSTGATKPTGAAFDQDALVASLEFVKGAKSGPQAARVQLSLNSRVNEQELFAALVHSQLQERRGPGRRIFEERLQDLLPLIKERDPVNYVFRAVKRIVRSLVREGILAQDGGKEIRRYAIGMAQLDDDRTRLSVARQSSDSKETPLRALKTVLAKVPENEIATDDELAKFHEQNRSELPILWRDTKVA